MDGSLNQSKETTQPQKLWLGLPPSEKDTYQGPMQRPDYWVVWITGLWIVFCAIGTIISMTTSNEFLAATLRPPEVDQLAQQLARQLPTMLMMWALLGWVVEKLSVNVAYTRKFGHILATFLMPLFLTPAVIDGDELYHRWYMAVSWNALSAFIIPFVILIGPIRSRIKLMYYCHRSFDRPEDRPYTLIWLLTQFLAISLIFLPMTQYFVSKGLWSLYLIAAFANGLGDGLAEPVGKVFGKKKYKVRALFTDREYTRSYVGSACVAFFTALGILINYSVLSTQELLILLAVLPAVTTIVEAKSPHTWDNFLLYASCWIVIYLVVLA